MKQLTITILLIFAIMSRIKAQISPIQGQPCPADGKFEYDAFEKMVKEIKENCSNDLLPKYEARVNLCKTNPNPKRCLDEVSLDKFLNDNPTISFSDDEKKWLLDHDDILCQLPKIKLDYLNLDLDYVINILITRSDITLDKLIDGARLWGPDNNYKSPEIEATHIIIDFLGIPTTKPNELLLANTPSRGNTNDLEHSSDCSNNSTYTSVRNDIKPWSVAKHKEEMLDLMIDFSSGVLEDVAIQMANTFFINSSPSNHYHLPNLSSAAYATPEMNNFIIFFGKELEKELKNQNGDINKIQSFTLLQDQHPKFNSYIGSGLTICMNDTEQSFIYLKPNTYSYSPTTGYWNAEFDILILDHFGMDDDDVLGY